jgi:hypothetical protein
MNVLLHEQPSSNVIVPDRITETVHVIVERAKIDRKGVFWPLGTNYRQANLSHFESSLGYGSAGILLTLLEYYRLTNDKEVAEILEKGTAWILHQMETVPFQHGYYAGTGGLWYFCNEIEGTFPGICGDWKAKAVESLSGMKVEDASANLASGVAGTIVAAMASLKLESSGCSEKLKPLIDMLVAGTKPTAGGVFWDFSPTSFKPPVGFVNGNAGIDYCLSCLSSHLNVSCDPLLASSLAYADSTFDNSTGNWPDQDATIQFKRIKRSDMEKSMLDGTTDKIAASIKVDDSISWGVGTVGILASRALVAKVQIGTSIGNSALDDSKKSVARLGNVTARELAGLDSSLCFGLPGLILALKALSDETAQPQDSIIKLANEAERILAERKPVVEDDDLSLLTGTCGLAYARLKLLSAGKRHDCLDPLADIPVSKEKRESEKGDIKPMLVKRFPHLSSVPEAGSLLDASCISIDAISKVSDSYVASHPSEPLAKAIAHEVGIYQDLAKINFQNCFWHEVSRQRKFFQGYVEGMDDALLFERFGIDESVTLFELDYDPTVTPVKTTEQPVFLLRLACSRGVFEVKLSQLQYGLITGFKDKGVALEVIHKVIKRVETPNVTQRQLADLSLKMLRAFVQAGYLSPDTPNKLTSWNNRRRLKQIKHNLFPASN